MNFDFMHPLNVDLMKAAACHLGEISAGGTP